ncbi:MAG: hypothetical protein WBH68_02985 [Erysipelotrichaceae bacterium]|jgi:hypothetical protein|nr:hypothetical protein [Bacillota bacterium]
MTKFSRVAKYEELRNRLNNDVDNEIKSKELSEFANRLNKIKPMEQSIHMDHDPIFDKREQYLSNTTNIPISAQTRAFDNEYLDEYINEVKQYNRDQGLLVSDDTGRNILNELYGDKIPVINKPFQPQKETPTTDIPFQSTPSINPYSNLSDEDLERTRSDIASEVKNLINSDTFYNPIKDIPEEVKQKEYDFDKTQNKLIEETDKIKLQLDEYEDNLDDFEGKIQSTNRILNFILVLLIFALIIVLGFVVYWILLNKGII